jgi:nickel-dependent lactate racemase
MAEATEFFVGMQPWSVSVPPGKAVEPRREPIRPPTVSPRELVRDALEHPFGFEALRRALTPDDHVTIVLDPALPYIPALLEEVLAHLRTAGVEPAAVTVLTPPGASQSWIDDLPDEYADLHVEEHDPAEPRKLAYLASTKAGRRVYLNRTLVEAEFVILLTGRGYDPVSGYAGAESAVFPAMSNDETRAAFAGDFSPEAPGGKPRPVRTEAAEILWLLGTPFLVQLIPGEGDTIQEVVAGLPDSGAEGVRRHDARWRATVAEQPDLVIAAISGDPDSSRVSFADLAKAAACAARVVRPGGRIAVLSTAAPALGEGVELLRKTDDPVVGAKRLAKEKPDDRPAGLLWCFAAKAGNLFLASGYPDEVAEELYATPIRSASEVQRLVDAAERVLVIPDAHRSMVTVNE